MANIFINGLNAKAGGGKSILNNYLKILKNMETTDKYYVLTPNKEEYTNYESKQINIIDIPKLYKKNILSIYVYTYFLNKYLKKLNIDIIFNLADIPIKTKIKQIFLFDWPYAVYPESVVWKMMDIKSLISRKIKLFMFQKLIKHIDILIAQTPTMKERLERIYKFQNIIVVPNAVSLENMSGGVYKDFNLPKEDIKLLHLTHYYPHKNLEIFIPLAKNIKEKNLNYKIIITIDKSQHIGAEKLLEKIEAEKLNDIIINIGAVEMKHVPSLYKQCDGLLMPTLLESFSGTYVEAMYHEKPIFTSDIDFAKGVCFDGAIYFNPFDEMDILKKLNQLFESQKEKKILLNNSSKILASVPNWEKVVTTYIEIINQLKKEKNEK